MQWIRKCVIYWEEIYPVDSVIHLGFGRQNKQFIIADQNA